MLEHLENQDLFLHSLSSQLRELEQRFGNAVYMRNEVGESQKGEGRDWREGGEYWEKNSFCEILDKISQELGEGGPTPLCTYTYVDG